jgi:hypothetical protein
MARIKAICVGVLLLAAGAVTITPSGARTVLSAPQREQQPVAKANDRPAAGAVRMPGGRAASETNVEPPAAVDPATYAAEKAAARRGPAPGNPDIVSLPDDGSAVQAPSVSPNFTGLDRQTAANNGFVFSPPDTIVAKSTSRVLEGANSALRLFTNTGTILQTRDLNTFFSASTTNGRLFDPKVFYDRNATNPRLFVVALQVAGRDNSTSTDDVSRIWVAVSRSSNPSTLNSSDWCRYNIDGRRETGTTNVSWADYPQIGVGADSFSFAMNNFRFTDRAFRFSYIHVWNKTIAENNATSCPTVPRFTFTAPGAVAGNFNRFTIQPAQSYTSPSSFTGTTNPAYYMSTTRGSSNEYHVFRVRNVASGSPTITRVILTGSSYAIPPSGPQPSSSIVVDSGDNRMLQVAGIGNRLFGIFTTSCNFTGGTANESCTRAPRVTVGQNTSGGLTASLIENVLAGFGDGVFVHHASIATNTGLTSGSTWEFNGSLFRLSSAAMIRNVNAAWSGVQTYANGSCSLPATSPSTTTARSGDYSGAQLDPSNLTTLWLAGERATTTDTTCQWQTRIAGLVP